MSNSQNSTDTNEYTQGFTELFTQPSEYEPLSLDLSDADLDKMLINSLQSDRDFWNNAPWRLQDTDVVNTAFLLGDQTSDEKYLQDEMRYQDNRLFSSARAILAYATGQLAKPDITPSRGDEIYLKGARDIGAALYQDSADDHVDMQVRAAVLNLISRKRAYIKLRYDAGVGQFGKVVSEVCNPEDIIMDRHAGYMQNPARIYHRLTASIEELCAKFPNKADEIKEAFSIRRGVYSQTSRIVTYFECWFSYNIGLKEPKEAVAWFIHDKRLILDKIKNPNWVHMKTRAKEFEANVMQFPPKPFVTFNHINTGKSAIDETCLIEQALPLQRMLNKRLRQIGENADYVNGRWVYSKKSFDDEDARKLINKGARTLAGVKGDDVSKALMNVAPNQLGAWVENTIYDYRAEIDGMMGTPAQFKGDNPGKDDTLGRDLLLKQQAGALQDDLVRSVAAAMSQYYLIKLQLWRVNYTDDYWFATKGGDGKYQFILINGDRLDTNVKVNVQVDSTLPLDKASIRATAMELWQAGNAIDYKTLMEDLGLPNPDIRAERYLTQNLDPQGYLMEVQGEQINAEAESDIQLLIMDKTPEERDDYDQPYFDYFNKFMASNRFAKIQAKKSKDNPTGNPDAAERITMFLMAIQHSMLQSVMLQEQMQPPPVDPAAAGQVGPDGLPLPQPGQAPNPANQPQSQLNPGLKPPMPQPDPAIAPM